MNLDDQAAMLCQLDRVIASGRYFPYHEDLPDKLCPAVRWSCYGLIDSNEIATFARCGSLRFVAIHPSPLLYPFMEDRIFGIAVEDSALSWELADQIWEHFEGRIREAVSRL